MTTHQGLPSFSHQFFDQTAMTVPSDVSLQPDWYETTMKRVKHEVDILMDDNDQLGWELSKQTADTTVYKLSVNEPHSRHIFKLDWNVPLPMEEMSYRMHPMGPYRLKWDSQLHSIDILQRISENNVLVRHVFKPQLMGIVSSRDTCELCEFDAKPDKRTVYVCSVNHLDHPPRSGYVRAWSYPFGLQMQKTENPNITRVIGLLNADMKLHMLPNRICEIVVPHGCQQFMHEMMNCAKLKKKEHDALVGWP